MEIDLTQIISKFAERRIGVQRLLSSYNILRIKRFLILTLMIFLFKTLTFIFLNPSQPASPIYFPLGITFSLFYLLGNIAFCGLFLGSLIAYLLKDFSSASIPLYLIADIGGGYLGAMLSQKILTSEIRPFANWQEMLKFLKVNAFITCPFVCLFQMMGVICSPNIEGDSVALIGLLSLLWLSDLNGILVVSGFLLSWTCVFYSREKVSPFPISSFILFIISIYLFMFSADIFYLLLFAMAISFIWALLCGYLIATALLFLIAFSYLMVISTQAQFSLQYLGLILYACLLILLFAYAMAMLWVGHVVTNNSSVPAQ